MRIGLFPGSVPGQLLDLESTIAQGVSAEADGFDSFWVPHLSNRGFDGLTMLGLVGSQTHKIELGTAVVPTYPRHPAALAQQAMTVQVVTGGRLSLGIGPSHQRNVEDAWGLSYSKPARHVRDYLSVIKPLVNDGSVSFSGDNYQVNTQIEMHGITPFPILISALAPAMLKLAGEMADGTITWMAGVAAIEKHVVPRINKSAATCGRPVPRTCVGLPVCVTGDKGSAFEKAARSFERYGTLTNYRRILDIEGADGPADVAIIGNEIEVENQLKSLSDSGATDFLAAIFTPDDSNDSYNRTKDLLGGLVGKI